MSDPTTDITDAAPDRKPDLKDAGDRWADLFGHLWGWDRDALTWRVWNGTTHWRDLGAKGHTELDAQAMEVLRIVGLPISSPSTINGTIRAAAPACARAFPRPVGRINFANGILDPATGAVTEHRRDAAFTYCLPYAYAPGDHPQVTQFLSATIPDATARQDYLIHLGLALLGDTRIHQAVLLIGPPRSGKSTLLTLANAVCGQEVAGFAGPSLFSRESEGLKSRASWNGQRLVAIDELPVEALQDEGLAKIMIAHGGVEMRRMYQPEEKKNQWVPKLLLSTNEAPRYTDRSGALTERIVPVRCPHARPSDARDPFLLDKLLAELPALAATCVQTAQTFLASGQGTYPMSADQTGDMADIERNGDSLKSFLHEFCVLDPEGFVIGETLYEEYVKYCKENGNSPMARRRMTSAIKDRYPQAVTVDVAKRIDGKLYKGIRGLRWLTDAEKDALADSVTDVTDLKSIRNSDEDENRANTSVKSGAVTDVTEVTDLSIPPLRARAYIGGFDPSVTSVTSVTPDPALPGCPCPGCGDLHWSHHADLPDVVVCDNCEHEYYAPDLDAAAGG